VGDYQNPEIEKVLKEYAIKLSKQYFAGSLEFPFEEMDPDRAQHRTIPDCTFENSAIHWPTELGSKNENFVVVETKAIKSKEQAGHFADSEEEAAYFCFAFQLTEKSLSSICVPAVWGYRKYMVENGLLKEAEESKVSD